MKPGTMKTGSFLFLILAQSGLHAEGTDAWTKALLPPERMAEAAQQENAIPRSLRLIEGEEPAASMPWDRAEGGKVSVILRFRDREIKLSDAEAEVIHAYLDDHVSDWIRGNQIGSESRIDHIIMREGEIIVSKENGYSRTYHYAMGEGLRWEGCPGGCYLADNRGDSDPRFREIHRCYIKDILPEPRVVPKEVVDQLMSMNLLSRVPGNRGHRLYERLQRACAGQESLQDTPYLAELMSAARFLGSRQDIDRFTLPESAIRAFVAAGADVNAPEGSDRGETPLLIAARNYGAAVCRQLLGAGADPNARDASGNTPLHNVSAYRDDAETAASLLAAGADPHARNRHGQTPMDLAMKNMRPGIAHALLKAGVKREEMMAHRLDVEAFLGDEEGCRHALAEVRNRTEAATNALNLAARLGHAGICRLLLEAGADPNRGTPLSHAAAAGHAEVCRLLLEAGADPNRGAPLRCAAAAGHAEVCRLLLEAGADPNRGTPLSHAAFGGHTDTCRVLIGALSKIDVKTRTKALNDALAPAIQEGKPEVLHLLLEAGAQKSAIRPAYMSLAVRSGNADVCRTVLELLGKSALEKGDSMRSPLHECVIHSGDPDTCRYLISAGANVNDYEAGAYYPDTVLTSAVLRHRKDIVHLLLESGADANLADKEGRTALRIAILSGDEEMCRLLQAHGAKLTDVTPLHMHTAFGHTEEVRKLLSAGADPNAKDGSGDTPLLYAAYFGRTDMAELLLAAGADPNAGEELPLIRAARISDEDMCLLLLSAGADRKLSRRYESAEQFVREWRRDKIRELLTRYPKQLTPEAALDKVARERGLDKADFSIRYAAPYYVIERKIGPHMLGGGSGFRVNTCSGEIVDELFSE